MSKGRHPPSLKYGLYDRDKRRRKYVNEPAQSIVTGVGRTTVMT